MIKNKSVKCKICGKKYVSKQALIDHIEKSHSCNIPEGWNASRYENYLRTGKTEGRCVYCKKETGWNNATGKYNRMCGSEACKKKARDIANKNYIGLHGKPYTINDPEQQKKMVYGRKNSGKYIFEDEETGKKYTAMYDSSYGKDFFEMIDTFLNWDGSDIIAPSPHTYWYEYEGKKHFYIPDAYSTSLNLEIELKDGGDNPNKHPKIQAIDKVKEQKKDEVMASLKDQVNYIKICNKDYSEFFELLSRLKDKDVCQLPKWEGKLESITESLDLIGYMEPIEEIETDGTNLNRSESFSYYHLEEKQVKNGCWDEEQWFKTLPDAIKQELSHVSYKGVEGCIRKGNMTRFVYTLGKNSQTICLGIINIYWYDWYDHTESPDYEWDETFDINMTLIDEELNPIKSKTSILETPTLKGKVKLIKRDLLLKDPMLNYDQLIDFYHKRLFHENLNQKDWQYTYNELINVREYLQKVSNDKDKEHDKRMEYEAKKALVEINNMIIYMEDKNTDKLPVSESKELKKKPVYIVSWHYNSLVGYSSRIITNSYYNHSSISLTPDLEKCYAFSRTPEFTNSESKNGFCSESLSYMINRHKESVIKVDAVNIPENCYESIKKSIEYHEKHKNDSKFDYVNFGRIVLGIELKETNPNKMICSMFVDKLFKDAGIDLTNGKPSNLVTPANIAEISETNKNVFTVYSGKAINYDKNKVGKITMESIDIFEKGQFSEYGKYADLKSARGPIGNSTELSIDQLQDIVSKISNKSRCDEKEPVGNQNCLLCTWALEAQIRGYDILPRAVYSPRDVIFKNINGYNIVKNPVKIKLVNKNYVEKDALKSGPNSRYYVHVNWEGSSSGHEFMIMNIENQIYVLDAQAGLIAPYNSTEGIRYFDKINFKNSFMVRLDSKEFNESILKYNNDKYILQWNPDKDIPYLEKENAPEKYSDDPLLDDIIKFNAKTNVMEYIIPNNGNIITNVTGNSFINNYKVLTPKEFEKYNGGVCWDYVIYEASYFNKNFRNVKYKTFFHCCVDGNMNPTHTFLLFYLSGKVYWFESSWKDRRGIYEFKNENEALSYISKELYDYLDDTAKKNVTEIFLTLYNPVDNNMYGMTCEEYMNYMFTKPKYGYIKKPNPKYLNKYIGKEDFDISQYATESTYEMVDEACKNPREARRFVQDVSTLAKKYNANYFLVTDGASGTNNDGNEAVEHCRNALKEWEVKNGFNPVEDWRDNPNDFSEYRLKKTTESTLLESTNNSKMYFLSDTNMNGKTLTPRIPDNYFTKNGYEDESTKRVCFAPSIDKSLMALSYNLKGKEFYVHVPMGNYDVYKPSKDEVPDSKVTGELWVTKPVKLSCIGKIKVNGNKGLDGHKFSYGDKEAELYDWEWEWIDKPISETYINSSEMEDNIMESYLVNQKDIYYNKDKFDSGEINLCFITGHSGSGKTTMASSMQKDNVEHYQLDDLLCVKDHFTMDNLKEYGDLIYSYFNGVGKKFYLTFKELEEKKLSGSDYEDKLFPDFVHYAMKYAKSHKDRKYVIEGVWLFCTSEKNKKYFEPSEFDDYAFYIKGTSSLISKYRAAKRDAKSDTDNKFDELRSFSKNFFIKNLKWYILDEKRIQKFRDYFSNKTVTESTYIEGTKDGTKYYPVFIFLSYTGTNMAKLIKSFTHDPYAHSSISFDTELEHMVSFNRDGMVEENIKNGIWKKNATNIKYSLYMYLATAEEYESMRNFVNELLGKQNKLKYNLLGLTNFIFGRGSEREDRFFCSEFVSSVISAGNSNIIKTKPFMTSPYMLAKNKNFKFIKKGTIKNYDSKAVDNLIKDILEEEGGLTDVIIK